MRPLLLVTLCCIGCGRSVDHDKALEENWHLGLTEQQIAAVRADQIACSEMRQKLLVVAGDPAPGTVEYLGLVRLNAHHEEYLRAVRAGNLKTAARYFRQLIEGKTLTDLAWEQSAELSEMQRKARGVQ